MNFKELFKSKNAVKAAVAVGLIGMLLIFLSDALPQKTEKSSETATVESEQYREQLQQEVAALVKDITGDEQVRVAITLEGGTEYIYATEKNSNTDTKSNNSSDEKYNSETSDKSEETYIIIKTDSGEQPLLLSALAPSVKGVAVVCDGATVPQIAETVKSAVCTLLDVSSKSVTVLPKY